MKKTVIIGCAYASKFAEALAEFGFDTICMPENPNLDKRLAFHADLSLIALQNGKLVAAPHLVQTGLFSHLSCGLITAGRKQVSAYPGDISLCACVAGDFLICNKAYTDKSVLQNFDGQVIDVKQGYASCSICALPGDAIISADDGIIKAAKSRGIETLKIEPGHVRLEGFDTGFIGGASFCTDSSLYFFGDISLHPSFDQIESFAKAHGVTIHSLINDCLTDIGGAVVI